MSEHWCRCNSLSKTTNTEKRVSSEVDTMQPGHLDGYPGANGQAPIPAPPPCVSAWLKVNTLTQCVHSQVREYGGCQQGDYGLVQYPPYHRLVNGVLQPIPAAACASQPVPPCTYNSVPVVRLPVDADQNLHHTGALIGNPLYTLPAPLLLPAPLQLSSSNSDTNTRKSQQQDGRPYVKRPLNAFLLFVKDQRPHVEEKIRRMGNGIVNSVLGVRWNSLPKEEQVKYNLQAKIERQLHAQRHPGWSASENYGKKRKRHQRQPSSASMKQCVSPVASTSQADVNPCPLKAVVVLTDVMKRHVGTQTVSSDLPACGM